MNATDEAIAKWVAENAGFNYPTALTPHSYNKNSPDRCAVVRITGGTTHDSQRDFTEPTVQVLARSMSWKEAMWDAKKIYDFLFKWSTAQVLLPVDAPVFRIETISPVTIPQSIGQDHKLRYEYSTNYTFRIFDI